MEIKNSDKIRNLEEIIEIRDPQINVQDILKQIRENMETRMRETPRFQSLTLIEERLALRSKYERLRLQVMSYGVLISAAPGVRGKIIFLLKRLVRKSMSILNMDHENDIQRELVELIGALIPYLDQVQSVSEYADRIKKIEEWIQVQSTSK